MQFGAKTIINVFGAALLISTVALGVISLQGDWVNTHLSPYQANKDLSNLSQQISAHSAIAAIDPARLERVNKAIEQYKKTLTRQVSVVEFAPAVQKILAQLNDINADIAISHNDKQLPVHIRYMDSQYMALSSHTELQDPAFPYLTHIDGLPINYWLNAAMRYLAIDLHQDNQALLAELAHIPQLRREIGTRASEHVNLTLFDGHQSKTITLPLIDGDRPPYLPFKASRILKSELHNVIEVSDFDQFAYDKAFRQAIKQSLLTPLTILDLRRAKGSDSGLTQYLANHYGMQSYSGVQPPVAIARYRLNNKLRADYLQSRHFLPLNQFSGFEQLNLSTAIQAVKATQTELFSQWYARKAPYSQIKINPLPSQNRPGKLALLIGPHCKGECQWLVHMAQGWPKVVLVGQPTRGNFDLSYRFTLPKSDIRVSLSNSAVYNLHGKQISGVATYPDITLALDDGVNWTGLVKTIEGFTSGPYLIDKE
ncbi:S41 family peptidase [Shewanella waksmanii]|uniref:S41 family peptidase n=1 Tax=Shewanella waksmanii TaxID=213783 RepID=UPI003736577D